MHCTVSSMASARIAAIVTTFFPNSHAGVLAAKFLTGFPTDEGLIPSRTRVVSMYIDQIHRNDATLQLARQHGVPVYQSIPGALTLGTSELPVDRVLLIGEHGDYPRHRPREEFADEQITVDRDVIT